jgi:UDP-N-acetylglucosamine acyltransferase
MAKIHPTAVIDPGARLADDVEIGPYCVIESDVEIGPGCVLAPHVVIRRFVRMGPDNSVGSFSVLGQDPQDTKFDPARESWVQIGRSNRFGEHVTIGRATAAGGVTRIGDRTFWMVGSHLGHEARVEDGTVLANGVALGGHVHAGPDIFFGGGAVVHQYCRIGRRVMAQGLTGVSMHVPPYVMIYSVNRVSGLNRVGLRRDPEIETEDVRQIREAFNLTYRNQLPMNRVIERMDRCDDFRAPADAFRRFIKEVYVAEPPFARGLCPFVPQRRG